MEYNKYTFIDAVFDAVMGINEIYHSSRKLLTAMEIIHDEMFSTDITYSDEDFRELIDDFEHDVCYFSRKINSTHKYKILKMNGIVENLRGIKKHMYKIKGPLNYDSNIENIKDLHSYLTELTSEFKNSFAEILPDFLICKYPTEAIKKWKDGKTK